MHSWVPNNGLYRGALLVSLPVASVFIGDAAKLLGNNVNVIFLGETVWSANRSWEARVLSCYGEGWMWANDLKFEGETLGQNLAWMKQFSIRYAMTRVCSDL